MIGSSANSCSFLNVSDWLSTLQHVSVISNRYVSFTTILFMTDLLGRVFFRVEEKEVRLLHFSSTPRPSLVKTFVSRLAWSRFHSSIWNRRSRLTDSNPTSFKIKFSFIYSDPSLNPQFTLWWKLVSPLFRASTFDQSHNFPSIRQSDCKSIKLLDSVYLVRLSKNQWKFI